jgi:UDP-galactopyranose mutase
MAKKAVIIGGGIGGCCAAHLLMRMGGWDVTVIEQAPFLGAGNRTFWHGGHPYTFGPRHFLTQNEEVFKYMNDVLPIRLCPEHEFITYVERDSQFYNFPIHRDDVPKMPDREKVESELASLKGVADAKNFEEYWIGSVGETLYDKFVDGYSKKMWMLDDNKTLDTFNWSPKGVALKEGPRRAWDKAKSGYPYAPDGYNPYFDIATEGVDVRLSTKITKYDIENKTVWIGDEKVTADIIVNTASPDDLFGHVHGPLDYIGRDFFKIVLPVEYAFPKDVYFVYYAGDEPFTRIVEYKKFTHHKSDSTLIGLEIPSKNGRYYPMPTKASIAHCEEYYKMMPEGVFSIGRAGSFRYSVDIDDTMEQAMGMIDILKQGGQDHAVPGRTQATALEL